jgi:hypothetical protein
VLPRGKAAFSASLEIAANPLIFLASRKGIEPLTPGLGNLCSILLSYRDLVYFQLVRRFAFSLWHSVGTSNTVVSTCTGIWSKLNGCCQFATARRLLPKPPAGRANHNPRVGGPLPIISMTYPRLSIAIFSFYSLFECDMVRQYVKVGRALRTGRRPDQR